MTTQQQETHDWQAAGEAWGSHANDWSCLGEHYAIDVLIALFGQLHVGSSTALLDIACGSGLAVRLADAMGAHVAGIDAAAELVAVGRDRTPGADLRVGSMFDLPWDDESFDVAISINGIWGGNERALAEAFRVLRSGGLFGMSFWGAGPPLDIKTIFRVFAVNGPQEHRASMRRLNDISAPGVAEAMLASTGFTVLERGARTALMEWPDAEIAWRAISSLGPAAPALRMHDPLELKHQVLTALEPCRDAHGIYRTRSDHQYVTARKP